MTNAAATAIRHELGEMPEWDLSDLYEGPEAPALERDLQHSETQAKDFHDRYQGKLAELSGDTLGTAVAEYEALSEILGRIMSYAQLHYSGNVSDPARGRFYQAMQERVTGITLYTLFFTLELNRLDDAQMAAKLKSAKLAHYQPWLRDLRVFRPHQLSDEIERLLHEKEVAGWSSWTRLFDETIAELRFDVNGKTLTETETLHLLSDKDGETRKAAAKALGVVFGTNIRVFSHITNTLVKDKEIEDKWRNYAQPWSSRNLSNQVEDEVVDALVHAVKNAYGRMAHRYYKLKAKWFGVDALPYWDRNAPLPDDADRVFTWPQARDTVLDAYGRFSPELASHGQRFFDNRWIDVPARAGKAGGAFAHPTVPSAHPYLLLNFMGKARDVMTLAHELGHGVHQLLAGAQGALMADTPLTLAETASVFGEMLTFRAMLDSETDPKRRRALLAGKVEDMLNTVVRQIAFYDFERTIHSERRQGELSAERLGEIWLAVQSESLGPSIRFEEEYRHFWAYIPHFVHSPFYVYAYAFGDCLVNSLYDVYRSGAPGFQDKYLDMLRAGGTLRHRDLLKPFGLDASDPAFWARGLNVVVGFIDELEEVA